MIGVTGATGFVGGHTARYVAERDAPLRLIVRDPTRAPDLGAEVRAASSYGAGDEMRAALEGVDTLFLVPAEESVDRIEQHRTAVDAAVAAGVGRIVYLSFVAAAVLTTEGHEGQIYDVTGREALSMADAAAQLTERLGRPIAYKDETLEEAWASRSGYGAPDWQVEAWISTYTAIAAGDLETVSDDVERLTGREPLTLREIELG